MRAIGNIVYMVHCANMQAWGYIVMALTLLEVNTDGNTPGVIEIESGWVRYCILQCSKSDLQYICGGCQPLAMVEGKMNHVEDTGWTQCRPSPRDKDDSTLPPGPASPMSESQGLPTAREMLIQSMYYSTQQRGGDGRACQLSQFTVHATCHVPYIMYNILYNL